MRFVWVEKPSQLEPLNLFERKVIRSLTGKYRKDNGHYYNNEELYNSVKIVSLTKYVKQRQEFFLKDRRVTLTN